METDETAPDDGMGPVYAMDATEARCLLAALMVDLLYAGSITRGGYRYRLRHVDGVPVLADVKDIMRGLTETERLALDVQLMKHAEQVETEPGIPDADRETVRAEIAAMRAELATRWYETEHEEPRDGVH